MVNLEIIGENLGKEGKIGVNRINHLTTELTKLGVNVTFHQLPSDYKRSKIKIYKRIKMRKDLQKQTIESINEKDPSETVCMVTSPGTLYAPILIGLGKKYKTILDIRDIYQRWEYLPYLNRRIMKSEQIRTVNSVDVITYSHEGFFNYLIKDINFDNNPPSMFFITNGANTNIFRNVEKREFLSESRLNLIYAGGFHFHDTQGLGGGVFPILEIMNIIQAIGSDVFLTIIGSGEEENLVKQKIEEYNLTNVKFINEMLPQKELVHYICGADYSISSGALEWRFLYEEGIATKVFESLCCGVPTLTIAGKRRDELSKDYALYNCKNWDISKCEPVYDLPLYQIASDIMKLPKTTDEIRKGLSRQAYKRFSFTILANIFKWILDDLIDSDD